MVDYNVNGKVAVVTGGTRGLGLYCAETFVLNGASTVVITSRKVKACQEAKLFLEKLAKDNNKQCEIISVAYDLADEDQCTKFFKDVSSRVKKVDILIANAGASWGAPLEEHAPSAVKKVLNLNVVAVYQTIQLFAPILEKSGTPEDPSRIIIMSSIASMVCADPVGTFGYLASKAGVTHMGKNLAIMLGPRNINVNSLAPGFFPTKMSNGLLEVAGEMMIASNPKGRLGEKEDIQDIALFLCSKQSRYINGAVIPVDGGAHLVGHSSKL